MEDRKLNIFIIDQNKLVVNGLKYYLQNRYGQSVQINTFSDVKSFLQKADEKIDILIMDDPEHGNSPEVLTSITSVYPEAKVIPLSSNESVALMLETFRQRTSSE
jgi:DNA-binding NarL/FixJ family response regulator